MVRFNLNASVNDAELWYSKRSFVFDRAWLANLEYSTSPLTVD